MWLSSGFCTVGPCIPHLYDNLSHLIVVDSLLLSSAFLRFTVPPISLVLRSVCFYLGKLKVLLVKLTIARHQSC